MENKVAGSFPALGKMWARRTASTVLVTPLQKFSVLKAWFLYRNSNEIEALAVITQQAWNKVIIRWY